MSAARHALVLVLATALAALAQTESTSTTTSTTFPPTVTEFETSVKGTVPDLTGRWLVVAWLEIPGGQKRTAPALWEVVRKDGELTLLMPFVLLPPKMGAAMDRGAEQAQNWEPSAQDLSEIANSWDKLEKAATRPAKLESFLTGRDAFDATFTSEPRAKDAQWVLLQTETFDASAAPAVRQVNVVMALEPRDDGYRGNYISTLLAAAPFPIPITFNGTFQMYRLPAPSTGLLSRLAGVFRGCGK